MQDRIERNFSIINAYRRKKYYFFVPFIILIVVCVAIAFALPVYYKSSTTILVEGSNIPEGIVEANYLGYVDQRLDTITQRIMSRTKLMDVIEKYNLYHSKKDRYTVEEIVSFIRDKIEIETIASDVFQDASTLPIRGTISFTLSFQDTDPSVARNITNELSGLYLIENQANVERRIENTMSFWVNEEEISKTNLIGLENKIAEFKTKHLKEMPQLIESNIDKAAELENEIDRLREELKSLIKRKTETEGEILITDPNSSVIEATGQRVLDTSDRLEMMRFEYLKKKATFSDKHPEMIILKSEINELEKKIGNNAKKTGIIKNLKILENEYDEKSRILGEKHPDLITLQDSIKLTKEEIQKIDIKAGHEKIISEKNPDNPIYITLQTNLKTIIIDIKATNGKIKSLQRRLGIIKRRIENSPEIERTYINLTREYEHLKAQHEQILRRIADAEAVQEVDNREKGEKFTVIDQASWPQKPFKPNIPIIFLLGCIISGSIAGLIFYFSEYYDLTIHNDRELSDTIKIPVLASVPYIDNKKDIIKRSIFLTVKIIAFTSIIILSVLAYNYYVINYHMVKII